MGVHGKAAVKPKAKVHVKVHGKAAVKPKAKVHVKVHAKAAAKPKAKVHVKVAAKAHKRRMQAAVSTTPTINATAGIETQNINPGTTPVVVEAADGQSSPQASNLMKFVGLFVLVLINMLF